MAMQSQLAESTPIHFDSTWLGFGGVHGGLLVGALAEAAAKRLDAIPMAVSAHMYAPVPPGHADIAVDVHHGGRSGSAQASIGGAVTALVRTSREPVGELTWPRERAVSPVKNPERLARLELPVDFVPFSQHLDIRPVNAARPGAGGSTPEFVVYIRLLDSFGLSEQGQAAVLLDALPPGLFAMMTAPTPIPTIEMTAHFAPVSTTGNPWHYLRHRTVWSTTDLCVDETELFTATGGLAAQARQLRRIVR